MQNNNLNSSDSLVFEYSVIISELLNGYILTETNRLNAIKKIKEQVKSFVDDDYNSQRENRTASIIRVVDESANLDDALKPPFSSGNSYFTRMIHYLSMFRACVDCLSIMNKSEQSTVMSIISGDVKIKQNKINKIMEEINSKILDPDFINGFIKENPDIDNLEKKQTTRIIPLIKRKKPRYYSWALIGLFVTATPFGIYFYLKKK